MNRISHIITGLSLALMAIFISISVYFLGSRFVETWHLIADYRNEVAANLVESAVEQAEEDLEPLGERLKNVESRLYLSDQALADTARIFSYGARGIDIGYFSLDRARQWSEGLPDDAIAFHMEVSGNFPEATEFIDRLGRMQHPLIVSLVEIAAREDGAVDARIEGHVFLD